ncbi:hypothetical protein G6O69_08785 [Pseudenhygromyxa sp. WMMC2535]|uniref:hypothetical protein n=1 Tax=Pseudenhygromyxa sp. WMMC2535 TaxID=2712867 RepID=UPI001552A187|nr:hypothetical protein [Pseudenhygromyxa sp. WMMC2535]NVB37929.1 hypothetical protein [Pseudenhygromyxa sp. WMMC2535]
MKLHLALLSSIIPLSLSACAAGADGGDDGFLISAGNVDDGDNADEVSGTAEETGEGTGTESAGDTTTESTGSESTGETETETETETGLEALPCDEGFMISPNPAVAGQAFEAAYANAQPFAYIGMSVEQIEGAGAPVTGNEDIGDDGDGNYVWTYTVNGHGTGIVELTFTKEMGQVQATCQVHVL